MSYAVLCCGKLLRMDALNVSNDVLIEFDYVLPRENNLSVLLLILLNPFARDEEPNDMRAASALGKMACILGNLLGITKGID